MFKIETLDHDQLVIGEFDESFEHGPMEFQDALEAAVLKVVSSHGSFDLLVDWTKVAVMTQPEAKQAQRVISWCNDKGLRKAANVMKSATQRMQVKRVAERGEHFQFFETREAAEAWLKE